MGRRVGGEGYLVPLGLLPYPTMPRPFAILFRTARRRLSQARRYLPPIAMSCSPACVRPSLPRPHARPPRPSCAPHVAHAPLLSLCSLLQDTIGWSTRMSVCVHWV